MYNGIMKHCNYIFIYKYRQDNNLKKEKSIQIFKIMKRKLYDKNIYLNT